MHFFFGKLWYNKDLEYQKEQQNLILPDFKAYYKAIAIKTIDNVVMASRQMK